MTLTSLSSFSQDSTSVNKQRAYGAGIYFTLAPRVGVGIHYNPYYEVGLSGILVNTEHLEFGATSLYSTMVFHQTSKNSSFNTYGVKLGVQASWAIFMWGIESKILFFKNSPEFYISPKFGFSLLDAINIEYAINLGGVPDNSMVTTRHQVSINFSLNRKLYKEFKYLSGKY